MNTVCANPATALARRLAACVNSTSGDDRGKATGYSQEAANLRATTCSPEQATINGNAADLLDDWATQLYRKVGP